MTIFEENKKPKLHFERFEFKYIMNEMTANLVLQSMFQTNLKWDSYIENSPDHSYTVTSLYYDNPTLKCYREKIDGLGKRFKLRQRIYSERLNGSEQIFYEIKNKKDAVIIKDRQVGSPGNDFEFRRLRYSLEPNLLVSYKRKALQGKFQDRLRVTFDSDLRAIPANNLKDFDEPIQIIPGLVIVEVKYNGTLPGWFRKIITKHELDRRPFSKYCAGIEACPSLLIRGGLYRYIDTRKFPILQFS